MDDTASDVAPLVTPLGHPEFLAAAGRQVDVGLASSARLFSSLPEIAAAILRPLQNGLVQFYALGMVLGTGVFVAVIVLRSSR